MSWEWNIDTATRNEIVEDVMWRMIAYSMTVTPAIGNIPSLDRHHRTISARQKLHLYRLTIFVRQLCDCLSQHKTYIILRKQRHASFLISYLKLAGRSWLATLGHADAQNSAKS